MEEDCLLLKKSYKEKLPLISHNILKILKQINLNEGIRKSLVPSIDLTEDIQMMLIDTNMNS